MNSYSFEITCPCLVDGEKINYRCEISTRNTIMVETIDDFIDVLLREGGVIQEKLADQLFEEFGGSQRIVGKHKNGRYLITTTRS